jgi:predicted protein tyrosine phosphatase
MAMVLLICCRLRIRVPGAEAHPYRGVSL